LKRVTVLLFKKQVDDLLSNFSKGELSVIILFELPPVLLGGGGGILIRFVV
jgi:hypothetical protein